MDHGGRAWRGLCGVVLVAGLVVVGLPAAAAAPGRAVTVVASSPGALRWQPLTLVDRVAPYGGGEPIVTISCPSTSWCVAVDWTGTVLTSTDPAGGAPWVRHGQVLSAAESYLGLDSRSLTCPSTGLCLLRHDGKLLATSRPAGPASGWHPVPLPAGLGLFDLSCPAPGTCVGVASGGHILATDTPTTGGWTVSTVPARQPIGISCPSVGFCLLVTASGRTLASTAPTRAGSWAAAARIAFIPAALSCISAHRCLAIGFDRTPDSAVVGAVNGDPAGGGAWVATGVPPDRGMLGLRCAGSGVCLLFGSDGLAASTRPEAGAGSWVRATTGYIGTAICAGRSLCLADTAGALLTATHPAGGPTAWRVSAYPRPYNMFTAVSCAAGICAAVDSTGHLAATTDPRSGAWTVRGIDGGRALTAVDCPTARLCVAVDTAGAALVSTTPLTGPWRRIPVTSGARLAAVSCAGTGMCAAIGGDGAVYTTADPATEVWTLRARQSVDVDGLDCPAADLCVAADHLGTLLTSTAPQSPAWPTTALRQLWKPLRRTGVACPATDRCFVTVPGFNGGGVFYSSRPGSGKDAWIAVDVPAYRWPLRLACPTTTACYGITEPGGTGQLVQSAKATDGSTWTRVRYQPDLHAMLTDVACTEPAVCVAVDDHGRVTLGS